MPPVQERALEAFGNQRMEPPAGAVKRLAVNR